MRDVPMLSHVVLRLQRCMFGSQNPNNAYCETCILRLQLLYCRRLTADKSWIQKLHYLPVTACVYYIASPDTLFTTVDNIRIDMLGATVLAWLSCARTS